MSNTQTIVSTGDSNYIYRLKSQRVYGRGKYMTNDEKQAYYRAHHGEHTGDQHNDYMLMPDGTYYWKLSDRDIHYERTCMVTGGD